VDNELSLPFSVDMVLKLVNSLSPVLFDLALDKVIRKLQASEGGIQINQIRIKVLEFTDDLDIIGESLEQASNYIYILYII
jgi:hypothetical protein